MMKWRFWIILALAALLLMLCGVAQADNIALTADTTEWTDGNTYVASGDVTINSRVTVTGTVTLSLSAGCNLDCVEGIRVQKGQKLTIEGSGTLTAGH